MDNSLSTPTAAPRKPSTRRKRKLKEVRVRMYRVGFGDCFLLTFIPAAADPYHMLIDFGVYQSTRGGSERLNQAARNIRSATGDHIHTVVATHEHADHLSGFKLAAAELNQLRIDDLWMPWTADRNDPDGQRRSAKAARVCLAANAAVLRMPEKQAARIQPVLDFGPDSPEHCSSSPLWTHLKNFQRTLFLEPDDVIHLEELGVKIYVLGPSREIFQPSRRSQPEVPGQGLALNQASAFLAAVVNAAGLELAGDQPGDLSRSDLNDLFRLSLPFDPRRGIPLAVAAQAAEAQPAAGDLPARSVAQTAVQSAAQAPVEGPPAPDGLAFFNQYYQAGPDWRKIDFDWLDLAEALALSIDNSVNNTSLVLAIELVESGRVLLFPGDAQLESWRTWKNASADVADLLKRTVLYKIGHHGSHNATLKDDNRGINLMEHPDLVALLPLDEALARDSIGWDMPDADVWRLVNEKARGRVLRNDISKDDHTIPPRPADGREEDWKSQFIKTPPGWSEADWKSRFLKNVKVDSESGQELWLEVRIPG